MKIGIVSDTHNNIGPTKKAAGIFRENRIDLLVHAGDITSPRMLDYFRDFQCRIVLGNGDIDVEELQKKSQALGMEEIREVWEFETGGKKIIVFHGNNVNLFRQSILSGNYDYIIKGHTHHFENYLSHKTRVINPGALYGSDECSVAILDTVTDRVQMIKIESS